MGYSCFICCRSVVSVSTDAEVDTATWGISSELEDYRKSNMHGDLFAIAGIPMYNLDTFL